MSVRFLNEGFDVSYFNLLKEGTIKRIKEILSNLNEAEMSAEDKADTRILRDIMRKAQDAQYDKRRSLNYTPRELEVAQKYNLDLPTKVKKWDGTQITDLRDRDVDTPRGEGRNRYTPSLSRDIGQERGLRYNRGANLANYIRTRKEKGPKSERPYREFDKYATADDTKTFGDTTFTHDNSGRFGQDVWDKDYGRGPSLARGNIRNADLSDVEKDRVRINKEMSQPIKDMKAALKDRKENQADLDNVNLNYARNVADARRRFDDAMAYADEQRQKESERGREGVDDANSRINKLLKKESLRRAIEEKLASLNEAEMSDEDKHDTEILKNIYMKTQNRANAALSQEEKDILKKYNLERVSWDKNVRSMRQTPGSRAGGPLFRSQDFTPSWNRRTFKKEPPKADKINYADMARKRPARDDQKYFMYDRDYWDMRTPDYEAQHEKDADEWDPLEPDTYQKQERRNDNQIMTQNVRDMKRALRDRKQNQKAVDDADAVKQQALDKLKKEYEDRLASISQSHDWRAANSKKELERSQQRINKLLGKE